jgi:hypothetical protein
MTPPKKWPQNCENARMDCISLARDSYKTIERLIDMVHGDDVLRLLHKVSTNSLSIESKLIGIKDRDINLLLNDYLNTKLRSNTDDEKT